MFRCIYVIFREYFLIYAKVTKSIKSIKLKHLKILILFIFIFIILKYFNYINFIDFVFVILKSHLKEEAVDRAMWRARFGRGFGPVVRQTAKGMSKY